MSSEWRRRIITARSEIGVCVHSRSKLAQNLETAAFFDKKLFVVFLLLDKHKTASKFTTVSSHGKPDRTRSGYLVRSASVAGRQAVGGVEKKRKNYSDFAVSHFLAWRLSSFPTILLTDLRS